MSDDAAPERVAVVWSPESRAGLRAIEREAALQILYCVDRYLRNRTGDVKRLKPPLTGFGLPLRRLSGVLGSPSAEHYRDRWGPEPPRSVPMKNEDAAS